MIGPPFKANDILKGTGHHWKLLKIITYLVTSNGELLIVFEKVISN